MLSRTVLQSFIHGLDLDQVIEIFDRATRDFVPKVAIVSLVISCLTDRWPKANAKMPLRFDDPLYKFRSGFIYANCGTTSRVPPGLHHYDFQRAIVAGQRKEDFWHSRHHQPGGISR